MAHTRRLPEAMASRGLATIRDTAWIHPSMATPGDLDAKRFIIVAFFEQLQRRVLFLDELVEQGHADEALLLCMTYLDGLPNWLRSADALVFLSTYYQGSALPPVDFGVLSRALRRVVEYARDLSMRTSKWFGVG